MGLTELIATYATSLIEKTGYMSVFILMTMESMVFPVPSEAVMPFAGFLIEQGTFTFQGVLFVSTLGSIFGSLISYYIGYFGGMPFVKKFGKYALLDMEELETTERFFRKRGELTIFICRLIPVVRHLISIPAGTGKMNIWKFSIFTILGAGIWNAFLTYVGYVLKSNWDEVMKYSHIIDIVVVIFLLGIVALYVYRHIKKRAAKAY
ncbi:MAG: DedA family protein [Acidobacteriota bacterium]|nr:DedA family protein [Acidobacteriota bacterium]